MEPFRFVHAARLLLDHQLHGAGLLPDAIRPVVEDATLLAWDNLVETCLAEGVNLLLLAGDSIDPGDGLRGPAALIRGCERLAARDIPVVIAPGRIDPWDEWPHGLRWPANVIRLDVDGPEEASIVRDGRVLAVVRREGWGRPASHSETPWLIRLPSESPQPFQIRLGGLSVESALAREPDSMANPPANYRALGGGSASRTIALGRDLAHDPGPTQAVHPTECGVRGCTLVTVDAHKALRRICIPTAPVRFEQLSLLVTPDQSRDDLLLDMVAALEQLPRYDSDRVWLVAWNILGEGRWLETLGDAGRREPLLSSLHAEHGIAGVTIQTRAVRVHRSAETARRIDGENELLTEFNRLMTERGAHPQRSLARCLAESSLAGGPWHVQLESLIAELDAGEVAEGARRLGMQWFAASEELSS